MLKKIIVLGIVAILIFNWIIDHREQMIAPLVIVATVLILGIWWSKWSRAKRARERYTQLCDSFGEEMANNIVAGQLWEGCPYAAMLEILGQPADVDEQVSKRKVKYTYKYYQTGKNRYRLRVLVENGEVTGWKECG